MSKRVKSLDEIRESRILFDKNPPAFGYILITVVAVFLIVAVVWSIKTPKVYTIQAQAMKRSIGLHYSLDYPIEQPVEAALRKSSSEF